MIHPTPPLKPNPLVSVKSFTQVSTETTKLAEIAWAVSGGGSLDGTYGNYTLIYHLGHGNSCKLGFH